MGHHKHPGNRIQSLSQQKGAGSPRALKLGFDL
jgi:hypothetical protein